MALVTALTCIASMTTAQTRWDPIDARSGHAMAPSPSGELLVFAGKSGSEVLGDLKSLRLSATPGWIALQPIAPADALFEPTISATTGPGGNQDYYLVFGGQRGSSIASASADTIVYTGGSWAKLNTPGPQARSGHTAVTDSVNQRVLIFGGRNAAGVPLNDLWAFQGSSQTWTQLQASGAAPGIPSPRFDHTAAYDPIGNALFVFGGSGFSAQTWRYDVTAQTWSVLTTPTTPSARVRGAMAYHSLTSRIVLFGGRDLFGTLLSDTWLLDPSNASWQLATAGASPPARENHAMSEDATNDKVVMLGGLDSNGGELGGVWRWGLGGWTEELPPPVARTEAMMAYDSITQRHLLFGGRSTVDLGDTWEFRNLTWNQLQSTGGPSPRSNGALGFHKASGKFVLFGGMTAPGSGQTVFRETWEFYSNAWTPRTFGPGQPEPPPAAGIRAAYDAPNSRLYVAIPSAQLELWSYDGNLWTNHPASPTPPSRINYAMAFDDRRQRLVLWGGEVGVTPTTTQPVGDTWEWDGNSWLQRTPVVSPSPRTRSRMVFDQSRGRCVLWGGLNASNISLRDTWEWDGTNWTQPITQILPPASDGHALSYDEAYSRTVLFGLVPTWGYRTANPAMTGEFRPVASGCAGSSGVVQLQAPRWGGAWIGEPIELKATNTPQGFPILVVGLSALPAGVAINSLLGIVGPTCDVDISPDVIELVAASAQSFTSSFALPSSTTLLGASLYTQLACIDTGSNSAFVTSGALIHTLGSK